MAATLVDPIEPAVGCLNLADYGSSELPTAVLRPFRLNENSPALIIINPERVNALVVTAPNVAVLESILKVQVKELLDSDMGECVPFRRVDITSEAVDLALKTLD